MSISRSYRCSECPTSGLLAFQLVGGRCAKCRKRRRELARDGGFFSPFTVEGQQVWEREDKLGPRGGLKWRRRGEMITSAAAKRSLATIERKFTRNLDSVEAGRVLQSEETLKIAARKKSVQKQSRRRLISRMAR